MELPKSLIKSSNVYAYRKGVKAKSLNRKRRFRKRVFRSISILKERQKLKAYEVLGKGSYSIVFNWDTGMSCSVEKKLKSKEVNKVMYVDLQGDEVRVVPSEGNFVNTWDNPPYGGSYSCGAILVSRNINKARKNISQLNIYLNQS